MAVWYNLFYKELVLRVFSEKITKRELWKLYKYLNHSLALLIKPEKPYPSRLNLYIL